MGNERIIGAFEEAKDFFVKKNTSYSNAWVKVGKIFEILFEGKEIKLSTEKDFIIMEIMTRKLEKFIRFLWQSLGEDAEELVGENVLETLKDDGIYSFMLLGYLIDFSKGVLNKEMDNLYKDAGKNSIDKTRDTLRQIKEEKEETEIK